MARDRTVEVLKQIRDEVLGKECSPRRTRTGAGVARGREGPERASRSIVGLRGELRETRTALSDRIDQTNDKVDALARRQAETEMRLATELIAVSHAVTSVRETIRETLDDRQRVDDHERRLTALERKAG